MEQLYSDIFHVALGDVLLCFCICTRPVQMKKVSYKFMTILSMGLLGGYDTSTIDPGLQTLLFGW